ncbi:MAG: bifunctional nicotinamidase/pyrazinamidase [Hyphomicrobiales bacterium]|nr:bifunctional nicotinamidase/pyrazinamidase [Hyphomicrobiales bacterium]MDE2017928.1 bifunctional nicotinamidase/pyrazinamidase [Hyphomicrobiales bacterium]
MRLRRLAVALPVGQGGPGAAGERRGARKESNAEVARVRLAGRRRRRAGLRDLSAVQAVAPRLLPQAGGEPGGDSGRRLGHGGAGDDRHLRAAGGRRPRRARTHRPQAASRLRRRGRLRDLCDLPQRRGDRHHGRARTSARLWHPWRRRRRGRPGGDIVRGDLRAGRAVGGRRDPGAGARHGEPRVRPAAALVDARRDATLRRRLADRRAGLPRRGGALHGRGAAAPAAAADRFVRDRLSAALGRPAAGRAGAFAGGRRGGHRAFRASPSLQSRVSGDAGRVRDRLFGGAAQPCAGRRRRVRDRVREGAARGEPIGPARRADRVPPVLLPRAAGDLDRRGRAVRARARRLDASRRRRGGADVSGFRPGRTDALVVVDVQNDFLPGGALAVPDGDAAIAPANALARRFATVVLTQDWHPAGHSSFASAHPGAKPFGMIALSYGAQTLWPDHCVQGSRGAALADALDVPAAALVIRKGMNPAVDSYSAFREADRKTPTGLAGYLRERGIARVALCGLATDYCVAFSAIDAAEAGFATSVALDACRAIDLGGSLAAARERMAAAGVAFASSGDFA